MQSIKMTAFFKRRPGAVVVFKLKLLVGTAVQVAAFRRLHEVLNDFVYSVLVEMCGDNQTAMLQVTALAIADLKCGQIHFGWPFKLDLLKNV